MFWVRCLLLIACLAATGGYLQREQLAGRFQHVDDLFLDFLAANARDRLTQPEAGKSSPVVLVTLREEDRAEFASWPPSPLDWQIVLQGLQAFSPQVIVIPEALFWGQPAPEFVPALAEALLPFPSVVLGIETQLAAADFAAPPFMGGLEDLIPRFQRVADAAAPAPAFSALITAPDPALRAQAELGLSAELTSPEGTRLPYALRDGEALRPSVLAQTLARHTASPYALHRLRLGPGSAAYLGEGLFVPLANDATVTVDTSLSVPTVNALDLMTGTLADGLGEAGRATLGKEKIIVLGLDRGGSGRARWHAQALSQLLSLPRLQKLTELQQGIVWSAAIAAAFWIVLRVRRGRALHAGLGFVFAALLISFLLFQTRLLWCPPTLPVAFIATGALVGLLCGRATAIKAVAEPVQA